MNDSQLSRVTSVPRSVSVDPSTSISDYLVRHAAERPASVLYRKKSGDGWRDYSAADTLDLVQGVARGLVAAGIEPGDHVAIMSATRFEWTIADLAIWHAGAIPVPIYETSSVEQAHWILKDADCVAVFAENSELADVIAEAREEADGHRASSVWVFEDNAMDDLVASGTGVPDAELERRLAGVGLSSPATVIYTSGTTGRPKGTVLTHGNFVELSEEGIKKLSAVFEKGDTTTLLFIPLAHVFARFVEVLALVKGIPLGHTDAKNLVADISTYQPTLLLSVPRIWEKLFTAAELKQGKGFKRSLFRWAVRVSIAYSRARETGGRIPLRITSQHAVADKLVYSKLRTLLGGRLEWTISGGAPLGDTLGHFYQGIGINMLEGYGLTETTAPINVNLPGHAKMGTVGPVLPGTEMKIDDDGEILVRGIGVFEQYHNNPEATAEAIQDGWFHTGDIGHLDEDGYLTITGRKKEIIVTASGKNVPPTLLEDPLRGHPIISQALVVGDKKPFVAVLVTLDQDTLGRWLETHDLEPMSVSDAAQNPTVREHIQMAIDRANRKVSRAESIREFRVLDEDFTVDNGLLTPSMKMKRHEIHARYGDVIEDIYAGDPRT